MQSIGDDAAHINRHTRAAQAARPRIGVRGKRKAFGAQRPTTAAQRAQYVAESILLREDEGRAWTWADYGLEANMLQQRLVEAHLAQLRWTREEQARLDGWYWEQEQARLEELAALEDDGQEGEAPWGLTRPPARWQGTDTRKEIHHGHDHSTAPRRRQRP